MNIRPSAWLSILLCFSILPSGSSGSSGAGFRFGITRSGLEFASTAAVDLLKKNLIDHPMKDTRGEDGDFKYEIVNIKAGPVVEAKASVELRPPLVELKLHDVDLKLSADWSYNFRKNRFIKFSDSGSLTIGARRLWVEVKISFGFDSSTKIPSVKMESCWAGMDDLDIEAHGGASFLYNTLFGLARGPLENLLKDELCRAAERSIDDRLNEKLSSLSMEIKLDQGLLLDYQLTAAPEVKSDRIEFSHAGIVFGPTVPKVFLSDDQPALCNLETPTTAMLQGVVTEDFLNSYLSALYLSGGLRRMITREDLPDSSKTMLDTNCKGPLCIPKWITKTIKDVANATLEILYEAIEAPRLTVSEERNISLRARSRAVVFVRHQNDTVQKLFTVRLETSSSASVAVVKGLLRFSLDDFNQKVSLDEDETTEAKAKGIEFAEKLLRKNLMKEANALGGRGVPIPDVGDFAWADARVAIKDRAVCIATNLRRVGSSGSS